MSDTQLRCSCYRLRRAARAITQMYDSSLEPAGVTTTQFSIMSELSRSGPLATSDIAERMGMDRTTMTRTLKPLLRQELIAHAEQADKRVHAVELTQKGNECFLEGVRHWRDAETRIAQALGQQGTKTLYELLATVEDVSVNARRNEDPAPAGH